MGVAMEYIEAKVRPAVADVADLKANGGGGLKARVQTLEGNLTSLTARVSALEGKVGIK
jgi:hypothetical protein